MSAYYTSDTGISILCVFLQQLNKVCMYIFMHACMCVCVLFTFYSWGIWGTESLKTSMVDTQLVSTKKNSSPYLPDLESCKLCIKSIDSLNMIIE